MKTFDVIKKLILSPFINIRERKERIRRYVCAFVREDLFWNVQGNLFVQNNIEFIYFFKGILNSLTFSQAF